MPTAVTGPGMSAKYFSGIAIRVSTSSITPTT